jgi:preprotein translocase subunit SecD
VTALFSAILVTRALIILMLGGRTGKTLSKIWL